MVAARAEVPQPQRQLPSVPTQDRRKQSSKFTASGTSSLYPRFNVRPSPLRASLGGEHVGRDSFLRRASFILSGRRRSECL